MNKMGQEIERKFLLKRLPDNLDERHCEQIQQGYLSVENDREVRLRAMAGRYLQTVKVGIGLTRQETEIELYKDQFILLWPHTAGRRLCKIRYFYEYVDYMIEIDIYQGQLAPLCIAEVEFDSVEASQHFIKPDFFGSEVTDFAIYKNINLVMQGMPIEEQLAV